MSVVPASIIDPIREEFLRLLPVRPDSHPLGCHNPRIADAVVFDRLVLALVSGMGYERVADRACSATACGFRTFGTTKFSLKNSRVPLSRRSAFRTLDF